MGRITIVLQECEKIALQALALEECRELNQQALLIIRQELQRRGLLEQPNIGEMCQGGGENVPKQQL